MDTLALAFLLVLPQLGLALLLGLLIFGILYVISLFRFRKDPSAEREQSKRYFRNGLLICLGLTAFMALAFFTCMSILSGSTLSM